MHWIKCIEYDDIIEVDTWNTIYRIQFIERIEIYYMNAMHFHSMYIMQKTGKKTPDKNTITRILCMNRIECIY
jgi:hypothetical protein